MTFLESDKINNWFRNNEHYEGFWDFVHNGELADAQVWSGEDFHDELIERGFDLAKKAGKHDVYRSSVNYRSDQYFIGDESSIITRLQTALKSWLEEFPQKNAKEKRLFKIKKDIEKTKSDLEINKTRLSTLQNMLEHSINKLIPE